MGWSVMGLWIIPFENLTEKRFSDTMKSLLDLPRTEVYDYEPDHPYAALFSTVHLSYEGVLIHGLWMNFYSPGKPGEGIYGIRMPKHLGMLEASWNKWDISIEEPYGEMFTTTMARIAEGMGAIYGTYTTEFEFEDDMTFEDFWKIGYAYRFLSWPLVEYVGRDRFKNMGDIVEVDNGFAIKLNGEFASDIDNVVREIWEGMDIFHGELVESIRDNAEPEVQKQEIGSEHLVRPKTFDLVASKDTPFFVCYYPLENHTLERYLHFFEERSTLEQETNDTEYKDQQSAVKKAAEDLFGNHEISTFFSSPLTRPVIKKGRGREGQQVEIQLISGIPGGTEAEGRLSKLGLVTAMITTSKFGWPFHELEFLKGISLFAKHLEPIYGFGGPDLLAFSRLKTKGTPPENRLWPINLWRGHKEDDGRLSTINEYYSERPDRWMSLSPDPLSIILVNNDLNLKYMEIMDKRTRAFCRDVSDIRTGF